LICSSYLRTKPEKDNLNQVNYHYTNPWAVECVVKAAHIDNILPSFGGEAAVDSVIQLHEAGFFQENKCNLLG
jgi:carbamoylphosphate synthase large subunit